MTTYWVSMTLCDTQMRQRQNQVIAWDGAGSKTKGAKKKWKVKLLGRREKATGGAKPGEMPFMPPIHH